MRSRAGGAAERAGAIALSLGIAAFASLVARPAGAADAPAPGRPAAAAPAAAAPAVGQPQPIQLDLGLRLGPSFRLGSAPAFAITDRAGASFGLGAHVTTNRYLAIGMAYEHTGLGGEQTEGGAVNISRDLDALWAELVITLVRSDAARLGLVIGPGFAWQSERATGAIVTGLGPPPQVVECSAGDSLNLGLRAGVAGEVVLGSGFSLTADTMFDHVRLASGAIGDCVPGAGTVTLIAARVGLLYRLDVTHFVR
jgi:hypothetical protein